MRSIKYTKSVSLRSWGTQAKRTELSVGLLLLKPRNNAPYRRLVDELHRNIEFMHFCNVSLEDIQDCVSKGKKIIDHSTLVKTMHRLGPERIRRIERAFTRSLGKHKIVKGRFLFSDRAICAGIISFCENELKKQKK